MINSLNSNHIQISNLIPIDNIKLKGISILFGCLICKTQYSLGTELPVTAHKEKLGVEYDFGQSTTCPP
jgi:hypothetical protein